MDFEVLGPLRLAVHGSSTALRSSLRRTLLARLLMSPNRVVPVDDLVESMWGVEGWDGGRERLWFHVSKLRSQIGPTASIKRLPTSYSLEVDPMHIDAVRFERQVTVARSLATSSVHDAQALMEEVLGLWRGVPYEDVVEFDLVDGERRRLQQLRLNAFELMFDLNLTVGAGSSTVTDIELMVADNPFHDRFRSQLIHSLWQSGRVSGARLAYEAACRFADEEFGGAVAPEIQEIIEAIDRGEAPTIDLGRDMHSIIDLGQSDPLNSSKPSHHPTSFHQGELTQFRTTFVGRQSTLAVVGEALAANQLVSLVGPAGVGKTRLAVETAQTQVESGAFDRAYFVDLAAASEPQVAGVVADAVRAGWGRASVVGAISSVLGHGRPLVVLDNCEHVIAAAANLVDQLNGVCPKAVWLATSRERLRLSGERVVAVEPLDDDAAERLLRDRAGISELEVHTDFQNLHLRICRRLDSLPLAIELAAERLSSLTPDELLQGLNNRFELLTGGDRRNPARQQTLKAALDWSLDQLDDDHRFIFRRCAMFSGPFSVADVIGLTGDGLEPARVRVALSNLVDRNLVQRQNTKPPYRLLETMRHYGLAELGAGGQLVEAQLLHADYFTAKVEGRVVDAFGPRENDVVDAVMAQTGNYWQAMETLIEQEQWERLAELAGALAATVLWMRGWWIQPFIRLEEIAEPVPEPPPEKWTSVMAIASCIRGNRGRLEDAERAFQVGSQLNADDPHIWIQGSYVARRRDPHLSQSRAERAVAVSDDEIASEKLPSLWVLSTAYDSQRDEVRLADVGQQLREASSRLQSIVGRSYGEQSLADAAEPGSPEAAQHCQQAEVLASKARTSMHVTLSVCNQIAHLSRHDLDQARAVLISLLRRPELHDDTVPPMMAVQAAAIYLAEAGYPDRAVSLAAGIPRRMVNLAHSPVVRELFQPPGTSTDPAWREDEIGLRLTEALALVMSVPATAAS